MYTSSSVALRQRTYTVCNDVKYAHRMLPIVTSPGASPDGKPRVLWSKFHDTIPVDGSRAGTMGEQQHLTAPPPPSTGDEIDDEESDATVTITKGGSDLQQQISSTHAQRASQPGEHHTYAEGSVIS